MSSDSKSKRSSNPNGNSKKKQTSNQKTLGMAWGPNSRYSSFRNSPFVIIGSYMAVKNQKLHEQFHAEALSSSHSGYVTGKPIFQGVSIFVDGYTTPSSQELRSYMLKHGGRFENYFSRHHVTHIICSNLPDSKIKNLRSFSRGLPIIKPTWILDSVAAGRLLNWVSYQLDQLAGDVTRQPKLASVFTVSNIICDVGETCATNIGVSDVRKSLMQGGEHECAHLPEGFGASENIKQFALEYTFINSIT